MKRSLEKSMTDMPPPDPTAKVVLRRYTEAGYNEGNPTVIEATIADDVVVHGLPGVGGPIHGINAYLKWMGDLLKAIPDAHAEVEALVADGDMATVQWTVSGTQTGEFGDLPATGEDFSVRALTFCRLEDGLIAEKWYAADERGSREQLGLLE